MDKLEYSKKGQRVFSEFVVQGLLYDYIVGQLDDERTQGVEEVLKKSPHCQEQLTQMKKAIGYAQQLRQVQVSAETIDSLYEPSNYFAVLFRKTQFDKWPSTVKWSMEALVVFTGIILFLILVPWEGAVKSTLSPKDRELILAELSRDPLNKNKDTLAEIEKKEPAQFPDEGKKQEVATAEVPAQPGPETKVPPSKNEDTAGAVAVSKTDSSKTRGGFLYRGELLVTNVEMVAPKIKDKIMELGGRKAGEVEIGWKKGASTYYYHFTLPEAKYNELLSYLAQYSSAQLSKEKHPRIMPDGIIRLIMTVDEKSK